LGGIGDFPFDLCFWPFPSNLVTGAVGASRALFPHAAPRFAAARFLAVFLLGYF
jgi:hypothetical protein